MIRAIKKKCYKIGHLHLFILGTCIYMPAGISSKKKIYCKYLYKTFWQYLFARGMLRFT